MRAFGAEGLSDELIRAAASGSIPDREHVFAVLAPQVRAMVSVRLAATRLQADIVDEISQQVLMALTESFVRLQEAGVDGLRAYVSGIVTHKVADYLRGKRTINEQARSLAATIDGRSSVVMLCDLLSASGLSPRSAVARAELAARVCEVLDTLKTEYRDIIVMVFFDQLTISQIAERSGSSRPAASMLLMRAIRKLRNELTAKRGAEDARA